MRVHFRTKGIPGRYSPGVFTRDSVREIVRNPFYSGLVSQYPSKPLDMDDEQLEPIDPGSSKVRGDTENRRVPVRLVKGKHQAIIPHDVWQYNQQVRRSKSNTPRSAARPKREYMLTGVGCCWDCWNIRQEIIRLRGITGGRGQRRYICAAMHDRSKQRRKQSSQFSEALEATSTFQVEPSTMPAVAPHKTTRRATPLEMETAQLLSRLVIPPEWYELIQAFYLTNEGMLDFECKSFNVRQELERCTQVYRRGHLTEAQFLEQSARLTQQLQGLSPSARPEATAIVPLLKDFANLWQQLTAGEQRDLLKIMFPGLYFSAEDRLRRIVVNAPFDRLLGISSVADLE